MDGWVMTSTVNSVLEHRDAGSKMSVEGFLSDNEGKTTGVVPKVLATVGDDGQGNTTISIPGRITPDKVRLGTTSKGKPSLGLCIEVGSLAFVIVLEDGKEYVVEARNVYINANNLRQQR